MGGDLSGRRILVTRDAVKAASTAAAIRRREGIPVVFPCIDFAPPADPAALDDALARLREFDRVVVTSPEGARILVRGAGVPGLVPGADGRPRLVAVGRATARVLSDAGATGVRVPDREDGDGLLEAMLADGAPSGRTLVLRAEAGREVVIDGLRAAGGHVDAVVAYRTVAATRSPAEIAALREALPLDAALFLSPSALDGLFAILGDGGARDVLRGAALVAIGSTTARAMASRGLAPTLVPGRPDVGEVLDALSRLPARGRGDGAGE